MIAEDPLTAVAIGTGKYIEYQQGEPQDNKKDY
jgi:actin-like ATPase involved in cell morphogenesis